MCASCGAFTDVGDYWSPPVRGTSYAVCGRCSMFDDATQVRRIKHALDVRVRS